MDLGPKPASAVIAAKPLHCFTTRTSTRSTSASHGAYYLSADPERRPDGDTPDGRDGDWSHDARPDGVCWRPHSAFRTSRFERDRRGPAIRCRAALGGQFGLGSLKIILARTAAATEHSALTFQYDFSFGLIYRNLRSPGTEFYGDGPNCTVSLFGIYTSVASDDPVFNATKKLKYGGEVIYTPISWFYLGLRGDRVMPSSKDTSQSFSVMSPKLLFHSRFITHEQMSIVYSKYFYGQNPPAPTGAILGYGAPVSPGGRTRTC